MPKYSRMIERPLGNGGKAYTLAMANGKEEGGWVPVSDLMDGNKLFSHPDPPRYVVVDKAMQVIEAPPSASVPKAAGVELKPARASKK